MLFLTCHLYADTFTAKATVTGSGSVFFVIDGIYLINTEDPDIKTSTTCITWSSVVNDGGYQQSDCYIAFRSTVTKAGSKIRIYTDIKNQNTYDPSISSYTGNKDDYFNGLVGQGTEATGYEESSYSVLPLAWHASTYICTSKEDLTVEGNVREGDYTYCSMIDKSDKDFINSNPDTKAYATVQWSGRGLRCYDDPYGGYVPVAPNATSYLYIGCNFNNAMPQVSYAAVIIMEAVTE